MCFVLVVIDPSEMSQHQAGKNVITARTISDRDNANTFKVRIEQFDESLLTAYLSR
jgi:hypothetical protein